MSTDAEAEFFYQPLVFVVFFLQMNVELLAEVAGWQIIEQRAKNAGGQSAR